MSVTATPTATDHFFGTGDVIDVHAGIYVVCDNRLEFMVVESKREVVGATGLVDPKPRTRDTVRLSDRTWNAICNHDAAEQQFYEDLETGKVVEWIETGSLVRFLVTDSGKYGEAARAARQQGAAVEQVDALELLAQQARSLVAQAAEMRSRPSPAQAQSLGQLLGELMEQRDEQQAKLAELDSLVEFAKVAILDTADLTPRGNGLNGR